jgi:hypothetical protein
MSEVRFESIIDSVKMKTPLDGGVCPVNRYFLGGAATLGKNFALGPLGVVDFILMIWTGSSPKPATYSVWPQLTQLLIGNSAPSSSIYGSAIPLPLSKRVDTGKALCLKNIDRQGF